MSDSRSKNVVYPSYSAGAGGYSAIPASRRNGRDDPFYPAGEGGDLAKLSSRRNNGGYSGDLDIPTSRRNSRDNPAYPAEAVGESTRTPTNPVVASNMTDKELLQTNRLVKTECSAVDPVGLFNMCSSL